MARCARPEQVAAVVVFARAHGLEIAIRCGWHSLAGHSSTHGIVVDVTPMTSVTITDGVVEVGAGMRSGELIERLYREGLARLGRAPRSGSRASRSAAGSGSSAARTD